jgi:peptide/nickel transport system ATP-binding protein
MLVRLVEPDAGAMQFQNCDLLALRGAELRSERRRLKTVFQDPFASLHPRVRVGNRGRAADHPRAPFPQTGPTRASAILERIGLIEDGLRRYPHGFSSEQRRADRHRPDSSARRIVVDERVSAWMFP